MVELYEQLCALGVVAEWSKVLTAVPQPLWCDPHQPLAHISSGSYPGCFMSSFHLYFFISLYTLGGLCAFRKPLPYNMYLFNLRIANHILIKIKIAWKNTLHCDLCHSQPRDAVPPQISVTPTQHPRLRCFFLHYHTYFIVRNTSAKIIIL